MSDYVKMNERGNDKVNLAVVINEKRKIRNRMKRKR